MIGGMEVSSSRGESMAQVTITIPDAQANRVMDAVAGSYGYQATIPDPADPSRQIPNPQGKSAFAKQVVANFLKEVVTAYEANIAADQARQQAISAAGSVSIT